jgi:hypothetical protein
MRGGHRVEEPIQMDSRVIELHCIMPIANIESVMAHGILSYERAANLEHRSVAMQPVQDKRDQKQIPGGLKLHQYANLYFHARNPMLYKRRPEVAGLCVLRVSVDVLGLPGTVITDCNAASGYVRYLAPSQWAFVNFDDVYALDWRHPDNPPRYFQHRSRKCAEVLVPHTVESKYIHGAYVADASIGKALTDSGFKLAFTVDPVFFFR